MNILDFLSQKTKRDKTELILIIGVSGLLLLIVIGLVISHFFGDGANNYDVVSVQYGASQTEHTQAQHSVETQMLYSNNEGNNNDKSNDNQDSNQNSQKNSQQNSNQNSQQNSQTNANGNHQQAETLEEHSNNNIDNAENHRENNTANNAENNPKKVHIAEEILPENNVANNAANNAENTNIQIAQQKEDIEQLQQQLQQLQQQLQQQKQQQNDIINNINNNNNNNNQFQESFATENVTENADTNVNIASVNYTNNNENNNNNNNNFIEKNNETDGEDNTQNNQQNNNNINVAELDTLNVSSGQFDNVETLSQSISQQLNMLENEKRIVREQRSKNAKEDSKYGGRRVLKNFINFNDFLIATKHYEYYVSFSLKVILTSPNYKKRFTDTNKDMLHNSIMKIMEQQDIKTFKNDKEMLAQQVKDLINGFFHQPNLVKEVEFKNFLIQESRK